ncbi:MAG TPA: S41 family peptidase [Chloroflexota bacterium]|nr:S41 family peptidase [Chloroflexota bacterium]
MKALRYGLASATLVILLCASFVGGARYGVSVFQWLHLPQVAQDQVLSTSTEPADVESTFSLFWEAWNVVSHNYVDKAALDPQKMTYGAIQGMINSLGDSGHSRFLNPGGFRQQQNSLRGSFIGIGAEVGLRNGQPIIINPLEGSPAQQAGIMAGDAILRVNGEDVSHSTLPDLMTKLRGDAGTPVTITILHQNSDQPVDVTLTRDRVRIQPVSYYVLPDSNVADIRLSEFTGGATNDLKAALKAVTDAHVSGIVLDLRDNPGGLLNQAVDVASQFLDRGTVVVVKDASGKERKLEAKSGGLATDIPLTVLVNQGTASAAEVVAGALEQNHRATLVGQGTFGTGTVLSTFRLKDGSAILLGTSQWLTPNGQLVKGKGVQPDVPVRLAAQSDVLTPAREKTLTPDAIDASSDSQLVTAVKYLEDHPEVRTGQPAA